MREKEDENQKRRIRNLMLFFGLTAVVISAATYAWFIGMRTVNVSSFDVSIAATDSLLLSVDGETWDHVIDINGKNWNDISYVGHTNTWGGKGLSPISTIGELDELASRMKIYEKASMTATAGGFRIMTSRVNNYTNNGADPEPSGYVAFDLFIKNLTGRQYLPILRVEDEEAIYLTFDSEVSISATGVPNTGIENSVRVAFAQIGRVKATTTDVPTITGITCNEAAGNIVGEVTGICRTAQIWEPNDKKHVQNAVNWYNEICRARTGADLTLKSSYSSSAGSCGSFVDGTTYPTYAARGVITSADRVDIYDGTEFNKYTGSSAYVYNYPYFTDSIKDLRGIERSTFMMLSPNSITKVRIYIYIEGQDIDNYDFASIAKSISVQFGFTKERLEEGDIGYDVPPFRPILTLIHEGNPMAPTNDIININVGDTFNAPVATAIDYLGEEIGVGPDTGDIHLSGTVDTSRAGTYKLTYKVTDAYGVSIVRVISVIVT